MAWWKIHAYYDNVLKYGDPRFQLHVFINLNLISKYIYTETNVMFKEKNRNTPQHTALRHEIYINLGFTARICTLNNHV